MATPKQVIHKLWSSGLTAQQIADEMGMSRNGVYSALYRMTLRPHKENKGSAGAYANLKAMGYDGQQIQKMLDPSWVPEQPIYIKQIIADDLKEGMSNKGISEKYNLNYSTVKTVRRELGYTYMRST